MTRWVAVHVTKTATHAVTDTLTLFVFNGLETFVATYP